ncbi:hypothetical protein TRP8649_00416 [Pelagimonas phthalicica]|uniref:Lipoprotein n=1 Tax=Pelagimonas phthalicica TaxID=1037362 RepID=A0A238J8R7_9RHOB|nr:hypothetical protein [Pelagimonas phthalicica]TDS95134.1 hypothetical protein CLV87_1656 [Pelagimonas phthalicica]SMX26342.1 hypothetical protein TRP8649_00416 [Pelagimonas phthalicica]
MKLRSLALVVSAGLALAGCAVNTAGPDSSPEEAAAAAYQHNGPTALTLYTMVNNRTGAGAHTSLMINAPSQRVVFDPAGSVRLRAVPEVNDVLYGITPRVKRFYEGAHARKTYHVRIQRIEVPPEVAERALRMAQQEGPVASARCAASTSHILSQLPGFENISGTWYPLKLSEQFSKLPGVEQSVLRENDDDDKAIAIREFEQELAQGGQ